MCLRVEYGVGRIDHLRLICGSTSSTKKSDCKTKIFSIHVQRAFRDQVHSLNPRVQGKYNTSKYILDCGTAEIISKPYRSDIS